MEDEDIDLLKADLESNALVNSVEKTDPVLNAELEVEELGLLVVRLLTVFPTSTDGDDIATHNDSNALVERLLRDEFSSEFRIHAFRSEQLSSTAIIEKEYYVNVDHSYTYQMGMTNDFVSDIVETPMGGDFTVGGSFKIYEVVNNVSLPEKLDIGDPLLAKGFYDRYKYVLPNKPEIGELTLKINFEDTTNEPCLCDIRQKSCLMVNLNDDLPWYERIVNSHTI